MNFLPALTNGLKYLPTLVAGVEVVRGGKNGQQKQNEVVAAMNALLDVKNAVADKEIANPGMFNEGLGEAINGVVKMLNASVWNKAA